MSLDSRDPYDDDPLEMEADPSLVLHTGAYKCLCCEAESGNSPNFTVTGEADPSELCPSHPGNEVEDFRQLFDEDGMPVLVDIEPLRIKIKDHISP